MLWGKSLRYRQFDAPQRSLKTGIHFIASSQLHMKYKLQMDEDEVLKRSIEAVEFARKAQINAQFSAEDATEVNQNSCLLFLCCRASRSKYPQCAYTESKNT